MALRLLAEAKTELDCAANWYNESRGGLGDDFLVAVAAAISEIEDDPLKFAKDERPRTNRDIRRHALERFPYSIIYERIDNEFFVIAISHEKQGPSHRLRRKTGG